MDKLEGIRNFLDLHLGEVLAGTIFTFLIGWAAFWTIIPSLKKRAIKKRMEGEFLLEGISKMAQRRAVLDALYADKVSDFMLQLYLDGAISKQEYRRDLRRLGLRYDLPDLLNRHFHPKAIDSRVKKNCAKMHRDMAKVKPGNPGPKIGETLNVSKPRSRVFIVLRNKLK